MNYILYCFFVCFENYCLVWWNKLGTVDASHGLRCSDFVWDVSLPFMIRYQNWRFDFDKVELIPIEELERFQNAIFRTFCKIKYIREMIRFIFDKFLDKEKVLESLPTYKFLFPSPRDDLQADPFCSGSCVVWIWFLKSLAGAELGGKAFGTEFFQPSLCCRMGLSTARIHRTQDANFQGLCWYNPLHRLLCKHVRTFLGGLDCIGKQIL